MTHNLQIRQQMSIARWTELIAEQKSSDVTVREFCEQRSLSVHAYYYWLRVIREKLVSNIQTESINDDAPVFTELPITKKTETTKGTLHIAGTDVVNIQVAGMIISLPGSSSKATIQNFLSVAKELV